MSSGLKGPRPKLWPELEQLYTPRLPMDQLPEKYHITESNPEPPLVHFAIPVESADLYKYAEEHNLNRYLTRFPNTVSPATLLWAVEHLSEYVNYKFEFRWPFTATAESGLILSLYDNYSMDDKMLVDEDEEDVIDMVQEALGFDKSMRPKWYFDFHDPWRPDTA